MIQKIISAHDKLTGEYTRPVFTLRIEEVKLLIQKAIREDDHNFWNSYPEDKNVYLIGEFDTTTGEIKPMKKKLWTMKELHKEVEKIDQAIASKQARIERKQENNETDNN